LPAKPKPKKNLSAIKKTKQSLKRNIRNKAVSTAIKTQIKKVESAIASGNKEDASRALQEAIRVLYKAVAKGVTHKNNASRKISRLTRKVNALSKAEAA